ncbi:hypothetical protein PR001_g33588, partial [Phytophthora rubi]
TVKTEVFRSEEADGSIVTKTVRTTTRTETSPAGELVTTIEVEKTTETELAFDESAKAVPGAGSGEDEPNWFMSLFTGKPKDSDRAKSKVEDSNVSPRRRRVVSSATVTKTVAAKPAIVKQTSAQPTRTTEIVEETVEETEVTEGKKPKSKKHRKPKRKPTAGTTTEEETTEVTEVTTETVEVTEEVPATTTTEETTE